MKSKKVTRADRRKAQPSWGYLIVLAMVAVALVNLLALTVMLLLQPTTERFWFLGICWAIAFFGLTRLPRLQRLIEARRTPSNRRPRP